MPSQCLVPVRQDARHPQLALRTRESQPLSCRRRVSLKTNASTSRFRNYISGDVKHLMRQHPLQPPPSHAQRSDDSSEACVHAGAPPSNHADMPRTHSRRSTFNDRLAVGRREDSNGTCALDVRLQPNISTRLSVLDEGLSTGAASINEPHLNTTSPASTRFNIQWHGHSLRARRGARIEKKSKYGKQSKHEAWFLVSLPSPNNTMPTSYEVRPSYKPSATMLLGHTLTCHYASQS